VVLGNTIKFVIKSETHFCFWGKGQNVTLAGKNHIAPHDKFRRRMSIGKLLKFYTKYMNCGLVPVWNINFRKKRAHIL